jgi:hypothetical protein
MLLPKMNIGQYFGSYLQISKLQNLSQKTLPDFGSARICELSKKQILLPSYNKHLHFTLRIFHQDSE